MRLELSERVGCGASLIAPLLVERLEEYASGRLEPPPLEALGVAVPIEVKARPLPGALPGGAAVTIGARREAELFPVFEGTVRIVPAGMLGSTLVLEGTYTVPLGLAGILADRAVLTDVAQSSLRRFLAQLKNEIGLAALRREAEGRST